MAGRLDFPGRMRGERIHIFQRRHWYTLIRWMTVPGLLWMGSLLAAWMISEATLASILPFSDQGIAFSTGHLRTSVLMPTLFSLSAWSSGGRP